MKNKLAIFDLDGTLFDTFEVNFVSYKDALKKHGFELNREYFLKECQGRYYKEFLPPVIGKVEESLLSDIHKIKQELYMQNIGAAKENAHLFKIIDLIKQEYHLAIVTTASRKNCTEILNYFDRYGLFDLIVTREDVERSKPDPEGFLKAMNYFEVSPENTMIFEDSEEGVIAAKMTGSKVFCVVGD